MHRPTRTPTHAASTVLALALLGACAAPAPAHKGEVQGAEASTREWGQSDINRVATIAMRENLQALYRLADKLYRRNPTEWRKGGAPGRDEAVARLRTAIEQRSGWAPLQQRRDIDALALALAPEYADDRVAAFIHAVADMLIAAHGGKTEFFLIDGLTRSTCTTPRAIWRRRCGCWRSAAMPGAARCCWPMRSTPRSAT